MTTKHNVFSAKLEKNFTQKQTAKKLISNIIAIGLLLSAAACATKTNPTQKAPGFLPNYSLLKPVTPSPEGTELYMYKAPDAKRSDYHGAIVESVTFYRNPTESTSLTTAEIEQARKNLNDGIAKVVSKQIPINYKAGPGVARVTVAITGATLEKEGFQPWNIIPVSAAIKLASMATNLDNKKPVLVIEIKIADSVNGRLLKEIVTIINGEKFRISSNAADEFQKLAVIWVDQAIKYSAK